MYNIMRRGAEHNGNWLTYFWSYGPLNFENIDSVIYLCPLCSLKAGRDTFLKLYANVYHHDTICKT